MKAKYSFYCPHERVGFDGTLTDPVTGEVTRPPARVKQSFVPECDINNILKQYRVTGQLRHISARAAQGAYQDLPDPMEFQESMNLIIAAEQSFASLPSRVRDRFGNDPGQFLAFMGDPANQDEMIKLGLATRIPDPPKAPSEAPTGPTGAPQPSPPPDK